MPQLGRFLITLGVLLVVLGGLVMVLGALPRFPGDIYIQRRGFTLYVPILGSLLLSIVLTVLLNLFFARR
jgi:uncharacterized membrane protein YidH (DUF202 family)